MRFVNSDVAERSGPHRRIEEILNELGISYMSEHDEFPPYKLDIFLPEWWLGIEIDGPKHSRKKDKVRDAFMQLRYSIEILRLDTRWPRWNNKRWIEEQILDFIDKHAETAEKRKLNWLTAH